MDILESREQIVKKVEKHGNSGGVYLPKGWIGENVLVSRMSLKERILDVLNENLEGVAGIYLYGSYARGEEEPDSDVDVLVIANKKFKIEKEGMDFTIVGISEIRQLIEKNPIHLYPIIVEAVPIFNGALIEELKNIRVNPKRFKWLVETTRSALNVNREFIRQGKNISAVIYSLIMRLRGVYLAKCILKWEKYTNSDFKKFVTSSGFDEKVFGVFYQIYRAERDGKKIHEREIYIDDLLKLCEILEKSNKELEIIINETEQTSEKVAGIS